MPIISNSKSITKEELVKKLRKQYTDNPPEGINSKLVEDMSDEGLLDMDYFLHEDVFPSDNGSGGSLFLAFSHRLVSVPCLRRAIFLYIGKFKELS